MKEKKMPKVLLITGILIITLILLLSSLLGCQTKESEASPYLSISFSKFIRFMEEYDIPYNDSEFETIICEYDLVNKELKEVFSYPQNTFYPLGVYDKEANTVYYSKEKNNDSYQRIESGDQIYAYNLASKEDKMLTENLFAVNLIIPVDNYLFFLGAFEGNPNVVLARLDLNTGEVLKWPEEDQMATLKLAVDKENKRVYVAAYNEDESYKNMLADKGPVPETIVSYDFNFKDRREILKVEDQYIRTLAVEDNNLLYSLVKYKDCSEKIEAQTEIINIETGDFVYKSDQEIPIMTYLSSDLEGCYFSAFNSNSIIYYDMEENSYESLILESEKPGKIVNFQLFN